MSRASQPIKLLRVEINPAGIEEIVKSRWTEEQLLAVGDDFAAAVEAASPPKIHGWRVRLHKRPSRTTVVIASSDPSLRFREALTGVLRRLVRSSTSNAPVKLTRTPTGFAPSFTRKF